MHPLDHSRLPVHVGIIMDGNGRWAQARGKPRSEGHREGLDAAKRVVRTASEIGLPYLSLYTFSTENWKRAADEIQYLMFLLRTYLKKEYDFYRENQIRIMHSGDMNALPAGVAGEIRSAVNDTACNTGLTVNLAVNYGGRNEIVRAVQRFVAEASESSGGMDVGKISEADIREHLDQPSLPDPDLIVRTAGELRLSNFLTWQSAYAELFFSEKYWPDWEGLDLIESIVAYQCRERRYGGTR